MEAYLDNAATTRVSDAVMEKMNQFEKKAQAESGEKPNAASSFINRITSTHPASEDRANDLKELIQKHGLKAEVK